MFIFSVVPNLYRAFKLGYLFPLSSPLLSSPFLSSPFPPLPDRAIVSIWQEQENAQETEISALLIANPLWNFRCHSSLPV